jgi:hypothetical protein
MYRRVCLSFWNKSLPLVLTEWLASLDIIYLGKTCTSFSVCSSKVVDCFTKQWLALSRLWIALQNNDLFFQGWDCFTKQWLALSRLGLLYKTMTFTSKVVDCFTKQWTALLFQGCRLISNSRGFRGRFVVKWWSILLFTMRNQK